MLSQASAYAISALVYAATQEGRPALIRAAAKAGNAPAAYLAKVVNTLSRKNLVRTQRGAGGGFLLARPAEEISLLAVCEALDDDVLNPRCMVGNVPCSDDRACPAHQFCLGARREMREFLSRTTIVDVAGFEVANRIKTKGANRRS